MTQVRKVTYLDSEQHADVLDWLSAQTSQSEAIRDALCAWVRGGQPESGNESGVDYSIMRQIIEAALDTKLSGLSLSPPAQQDSGDEADECEAILDELEANVLM
ncbi:MAG: hypothetical protein V3W44_02170 [Dehalococcoidales bacterium]